MNRVGLLVACLIAFAPVPLRAQDRCGVERWSVKTGSDQGAGSVQNLDAPTDTTVAEMNTWHGGTPYTPAELKNQGDTRISPEETTVWRVRGRLTAYKFENNPNTGDSDYHLVIEDGADSIVGEIPSPACVDDGSPFKSRIAEARTTFDGRFKAGSSFQTASVPVELVGPAFFDFSHGQRGHADNIVEIHPILHITFLDTEPPPPVEVPARPAQPPTGARRPATALAHVTPQANKDLVGVWALDETVEATTCVGSDVGDESASLLVIKAGRGARLEGTILGPSPTPKFSGTRAAGGAFALTAKGPGGKSRIMGTVGADRMKVRLSLRGPKACSITSTAVGRRK